MVSLTAARTRAACWRALPDKPLDRRMVILKNGQEWGFIADLTSC
jgi:hypothetical protein